MLDYSYQAVGDKDTSALSCYYVQWQNYPHNISSVLLLW